MPDHARLQQLLQDRKSKTKNVGRPSRQLRFCLDNDLAQERAEAEQKLAEAKAELDAATAEAQADKRAGGRVRVDAAITKLHKDAEDAAEKARTAADEDSVVVTFTAVQSEDYDELVTEHPPREGNEDDAKNAVNGATFPGALMRASISAITDIDGATVDMDPDDLVAGFSNGERIIAINASNEVNLRITSIPFSDASSPRRQASGSKSRRR